MQIEETKRERILAGKNPKTIGNYLDPDTVFLLVVTLICACYWLV